MTIVNRLCATVATGPLEDIYFIGGLAVWLGYGLCVLMALGMGIALLWQLARRRPFFHRKLFLSALVLGALSLLFTLSGWFAFIIVPFVTSVAATMLIFHCAPDLGCAPLGKWLNRFMLLFCAFVLWIIATDCYVWYA